MVIDGLIVGVWASLFSLVLTQPGEIFGFVPRLYAWMVRGREPLQGWKFGFSKPLYACPVCHAGQLSFWGYFLLYPGQWQFFDHFTFITAAMATAAIFTRAW